MKNLLIAFILIYILTTPAFSQNTGQLSPTSGTISVHGNDYENLQDTQWFIDIKENKPIKIEFSADLAYGCYIVFVVLDNYGNIMYDFKWIDNSSGYVTGVFFTPELTGKLGIFYTRNMYEYFGETGFDITYGPDNSLVTGSDLHVAGNGNIDGELSVNSKLNVTGVSSFYGKVGLGTSTASEKLELFTPLNNPSIMSFRGSGTASNVDNGRICAKNGLTEVSRMSLGRATDAYSGYFSFWTKKDIASTLTEKMRIDAAGNVGISTSTPQTKLDVRGEITFGTDQAYSLFAVPTAGAAIQMGASSSTWDRNMHLGFIDNNRAFTSIMSLIHEKGFVGIGTKNPDALLTVNGTIHAKEVRVDLTGSLADYVFAPDYSLMPLHKVEAFVKTNKHLPEIPSAAEVKEKGLSMGEMQNKLLQKIEELTLYVIELQKTNEKQSAEIEALKQK